MGKLFSIVIPTFNSKDFVVEAVRSALDQTYPDIEVIVDDNTSRDGTPDLLEKHFGHDPRFKLFRNQEDLNIPHGWNRGMNRATGEYRLLLHSDNLLSPRYVELTVDLMERYAADVAYSECIYFEGQTPEQLFDMNPNQAKLPHTFLTQGSRAIDYIFRFQRMIPTSCLTIRAHCLAERQPYHPDYRWDPDIELMTWLADHFRVLHLNLPLSAIRTHGGQVASWKDPSFTGQYESLLRLANEAGHSEPHHFLLNWAWANQDIVEKLSGVKGAKTKIYLKYLRKWIIAETQLLGFFLRYYARKMKLMVRFLGQRLSHK
jgi:glycosyltransferase involved in cell wall biosynthesis